MLNSNQGSDFMVIIFSVILCYVGFKSCDWLKSLTSQSDYLKLALPRVLIIFHFLNGTEKKNVESTKIVDISPKLDHRLSSIKWNGIESCTSIAQYNEYNEIQSDLLSTTLTFICCSWTNLPLAVKIKKIFLITNLFPFLKHSNDIWTQIVRV